ncbi:hypothetical protein [Bdellovibrio sp. BCCA]|uniref:hypothetical protein n=1 Tax=Bdellovibrio sp. BCCA TaxID=3136281 RepID=UPI0030F31216
MDTKNISWLLTVALATGIGCKQEGGETSGANELPSTVAPVSKSQESGCSVANVEGGAQITCGETQVFVPAGASAPPKIPRLINGNPGNNPSVQNMPIGDYLISVTKNNNAELITVWIEKEKAILQYENGMIYPRDTALYYNSRDCTGDGIYQTNPNVHSFAFGMADRIVYWDRYYRLSGIVEHCYPRSKKEKDGSCTEITGPVSGDFNGFIAKPAEPGVTPVLTSGYRVIMQ